jgi:stage II sporulation protein E
MQDQKKYFPRGQTVMGGGVLTHTEKKINGKVLINEGIKSLAFAGAAYLLGSCRLLFGSYPLGMALLCASSVKIPFILTGLCASAFSGVPYPSVYIGVYVIAALLRIVTRIFIDTAGSGEAPPNPAGWLGWMRQRLFGESVSLRMTSASLCAFIISLYAIITGGYRYYDLFGAIFAIVISPAAVWLLCGWFAGDGKEIKVRARYLAGAAVLMTGLCYSARGLNIMGISVAAFGAFFATLWICRQHGILAGAAAGLVLGLAYEPVYAPLFVLAGIAEGLLHGFSPTIAAAAAFASGMIWGLYIDGIDSLTVLLPGILLAAAAFCGAEKAGVIGGARAAVSIPTKKEEKLTAEAELAKNRLKSDEERLGAVSESFASLSEVFYNLSDRLRRPGIIDLRRVCDKIFDKTCTGCAKRDVCWGLEYGSALDMTARLCASLHENGRASVDCIPEQIKKRCPNAESIISDINTGCATLTEAVLRSEKISIFALDYDAVSRILSDTLEEQRSDFARTEDCENKVCAVFEKYGITPDVLYVYGGRRKYISARGIDARNMKADAAALRIALEGVTGCRLEDPLFEFSGGSDTGRLSMTLTTKRRYSAERVCLTSPANDDDDGVCGDSAIMFENGRDYFYALISDGMGTGSGAAFSSGICSLFLEKMLMAGNRTSTALRMLNGVLRSRKGAREIESSATVDLLEVDLLTGEASLIKSGAAPTYIRRSGDVFRLHSNTVPIGILTALDAQQTKLEVSLGDVIVMVSDGVVDAAKDADGGECGWLPDLLSHEWEDDLNRMAKKIIGRAQSVGARDDLSVIIVKIGEY